MIIYLFIISSAVQIYDFPYIHYHSYPFYHQLMAAQRHQVNAFDTKEERHITPQLD